MKETKQPCFLYYCIRRKVPISSLKYPWFSPISEPEHVFETKTLFFISITHELTFITILLLRLIFDRKYFKLKFFLHPIFKAEATLRISAIARDILTNDGFYGFFRGYGMFFNNLFSMAYLEIS